ILEAQTMAQKLKSSGEKFTVCLTSEMQRAKKVAEILGEVLNIPVIADSRLNSRNLGDFSGKTLSEIKARSPNLYKRFMRGDRTFTPPNGQSTKKSLEKTEDLLNDLKKRYSDEDRIIIVTHRESIGFLHYKITHNKLKNPIQTLKNCVPYKYHF
ncbi:MAG: histidine phosphatase family protein, partial [Promethearchaeota archaeon]